MKEDNNFILKGIHNALHAQENKQTNTEGSPAKIIEGPCVLFLSLFFLLVRLFPPLYDEHIMTYIEIEKINTI